MRITFKAMCSERWQSEEGWDPKCIMGDLTWLAVLLLFALSFSSLLWSVLAYFPELVDMVVLTPAFLVISVRLCNKDWLIFDWYLGASWTELSHVDMDHICNALVKHGPNSVLSLVSLVTSRWATVREDLIMQPDTLIVVTFTINRAWTRQTGMRQFQCCYCFMFQMNNVKNVYAPSDSSINNIYNRNASCHFWCCIRIYLSFPSWYLPSPVSVV